MIRRLVIGLVLVGLVAGIYGRAVTFGFVDFDDPEYVRDNWLVKQGLTAQGVAWAFETNYIANWHPLTWVSLMAEAQLFGPNARLMHATNIALHAINVLLLFAALLRMTGAFWRSAMVAALFAVHPLHVESVAWISERKDVLSTMFWMLAMLGYVLYVHRGGFWRYSTVMVCLALGLMCKAMLVTLPCVLLLLDWWPLGRTKFGRLPHIDHGADPAADGVARRGAKSLIAEKLPLLMVVGVAAYLTYRAQRGGGQLQEGDWLPWSQCAANAVISYLRYIGKLFWPVNLAALYPHPGLIGEQWPAWQVMISGALLTAITLIAVFMWKRAPWLIVGWLWFMGTLLPVSGLVQIGRQAMADRYAYVPFIGLYIVVAWTLGAIALRKSVLRIPIAVLCALWIAVLAVVAWKQVGVWQDSRTLFSHAIAVTDRNWMMHNNLGGILASEGDAAGGLLEVEAAIEIAPHAAWVHNHKGTLLAGMGKLFEAQESFEKANEIDATFAESRLNLGIVLAKRQRLPEAVQAFEQALEINANYALAHANLGVVLGQMNRMDEAATHLRRAIELDGSIREQYEPPLNEIESGGGGAP